MISLLLPRGPGTRVFWCPTTNHDNQQRMRDQFLFYHDYEAIYMYFDKPRDGELPCWIVPVSNAIVIMKASLETAFEQSFSVASQLPKVWCNRWRHSCTLLIIWNLLKAIGFQRQYFHWFKANRTSILSTTSSNLDGEYPYWLKSRPRGRIFRISSQKHFREPHDLPRLVAELRLFVELT